MDAPLNRDLWYGTSGPRDAEVVIVGESWGREEALQGRPFVGGSGLEFDRMLLEAGLERRKIFATNLIAAQPAGNDTWRFFEPFSKSAPSFRGLNPSPLALAEYERLHRQLSVIQPRLVIAAGNYALWALTDSYSTSSISTGAGATVRVPAGITSWRGSMLYLASPTTISATSIPPPPVLPVLHPAAILRQWYLRAVTIHDLKRSAAALSGLWRPTVEPRVLAPPLFDEAFQLLTEWLRRLDGGEVLRIAHDIETARGLITCQGFASGPHSGGGTALVIPHVRLRGRRLFESYWGEREELRLTRLIIRLLTHPLVRIEGQNYLYDTQYIRHFYGVTPNVDFDTMLAQHLLFPGTPKALDYLSSLYCRFHWYWKDDNKDWDMDLDEKRHLEYNAIDVLRTYECATELRHLISALGFSDLWDWEKRKSALALRMMIRGVRIDRERRRTVGWELLEAAGELQSRLEYLIPRDFVTGDPGASPWYSSPIQQRTLFYDILGMVGQRHRKTGRPTVDAEALSALRRRNPAFRRVFDLLDELRSVGVFHSTFASAPLDPDGRMRCMINTSGTETFRWSTSKNAFGRGTNLQNIPKGEED